MPAITIGAAAYGVIPGRKSSGGKTRTALIVTLISGDGYLSWKSDGGTGETPMTVAIPLAFSGVEYSEVMYVYSAAGGVVNYTEFPPQ